MSQKISTFLQKCFLNRNRVPEPGEPLDFNTFEKTRGKVSIVEAIRSAIAGEDTEEGVPSRIDEPLRDLTIRIWYFLTHIGNYYAGLFTPYTKDKAFLRELMEVWDVLVKNTILGETFVGYGEDLVELDKALLDIEKGEGDNAQLNCKFRLYTKSGQGKFFSILAGKSIDSEKLGKRVVKFWIRESNYWLEWWHLLTEFLGGIERVKMLAKGAAVRTIASVDAGEEEFKKEMESLLSGKYPVLKRKGTTSATLENEGLAIENTYEPHEFVPVDAPRQLMDFYINYFDVFSDYLGYGGKASPHKMERLTQQESFQGSDVVATIQSFLQKRLESCFHQLSVLYEDLIPDDFEIMISNRSTAQAIIDPEVGGGGEAPEEGNGDYENRYQ